jgi:ribosome-associated protein
LNDMNFEVRGDHVTLDHLLKLSGLAPSGGAAKMLVAQGVVQVDGQVELRKTAKLRPGAVVVLGDTRITVVAPAVG